MKSLLRQPRLSTMFEHPSSLPESFTRPLPPPPPLLLRYLCSRRGRRMLFLNKWQTDKCNSIRDSHMFRTSLTGLWRKRRSMRIWRNKIGCQNNWTQTQLLKTLISVYQSIWLSVLVIIYRRTHSSYPRRRTHSSNPRRRTHSSKSFIRIIFWRHISEGWRKFCEQK